MRITQGHLRQIIREEVIRAVRLRGLYESEAQDQEFQPSKTEVSAAVKQAKSMTPDEAKRILQDAGVDINQFLSDNPGLVDQIADKAKREQPDLVDQVANAAQGDLQEIDFKKLWNTPQPKYVTGSAVPAALWLGFVPLCAISLWDNPNVDFSSIASAVSTSTDAKVILGATALLLATMVGDKLAED